MRVRCREGISIRSKMVVQLSRSSYVVQVKSFPPVEVPLRAVTGLLSPSDTSSAGSHCESPPELAATVSVSVMSWGRDAGFAFNRSEYVYWGLSRSNFHDF